jgi:hypothetical protein
VICDLCLRDSHEVIRVDNWQVCQWCISNSVLEHALEVRANIKLLREAVAAAQVGHRDDERRKSAAEARLLAAHSELDAAIKELASITADSLTSLEKSLASVDTLKHYTSVEDARTRKARG